MRNKSVTNDKPTLNKHHKENLFVTVKNVLAVQIRVESIAIITNIKTNVTNLEDCNLIDKNLILHSETVGSAPGALYQRVFGRFKQSN